MTSYEGIGKTIEKAIEDALFVLKAPREDVDIKILEEGGLFKKARVLVSISEDCLTKYEKKEKKVEIDEVLSVQELIKDVFNEKEEKESKISKTKKDKVEVVAEAVAETEVIEEAKEPVKKTEKKNNKPRVKSDEASIKFLEGLLKELNIDAEITSEVEDEKTVIKINGETASDLIGYRGDCLNALQFITNVIESRANPDCQRIVLDIGDYRSKREETLVNLAQRMARKVAKTHHQVKLEPMNANERRIIHTTLQSDEYVETVSKGTEPNRFLIIFPKNK